MTDDELIEFAEAITSKEEFSVFLSQYIRSFREDAESWENDNLQDYLNALTGFVEDMGGYYQNKGENADLQKPDWKMVADILLAARVYGS